MKTYDVVAAAIEAQETGHCFALLGDGNMHFAGALAHLGMPLPMHGMNIVQYRWRWPMPG